MSTENNYPVLDWLLTLPLYSPVDVGDKDDDVAKAILSDSTTFDCFCPQCGKEATFRNIVTEETKRMITSEKASISLSLIGSAAARYAWAMSTIDKSSVCTRNHQHLFTYFFIIQDKKLIKIGQYPSLADIAIAETSKFQKVLTKDQLKELNKAIGLAAHGVGVGSYVYLRRIFESLIEEAHQIAIKDKGWDEEAYLQSRMKERVGLLAHHLPDFIVGNPKLYGLLSKGIHELTEEECLNSFDALKNGIFAIAEDKLTELSRKTRAEAAAKALAKIT